MAKLTLEGGEVLEVGRDGDAESRIDVPATAEQSSVEYVEVRPLGELGKPLGGADEASSRLRALLEAQRALGGCADLESVVTVLGDVALALVPRATHATVALAEGGTERPAALVTVATRVRGEGGRPAAPSGQLPLTRSVMQKVVRERAAVLAVDAPNESFSSESMLGANIQST
ncbi:MAG TPA: sigma-54-dependent Fis family transcriptional regulator, partial [Polyangiaceae bacterium]|nr:sigma-54-dependent Fis family transcriptional regulator [Polyangiaceae bacterium]